MNQKLKELLDHSQQRLKELESRKVQDEFVKGQIHELMVAIIHYQQLYLAELNNKQELLNNPQTKLLCIEDGAILNSRGGLSLNSINRVYKGKIYTGSRRRIDQDGDDVWYIEEVQVDKQASRFRAVSDTKKFFLSLGLTKKL